MMTLKEIEEQLDWYVKRNEKLCKEMDLLKINDNDANMLSPEILLKRVDAMSKLRKKSIENKECFDRLLADGIKQAIIEGITSALNEDTQ